MLLALRSLWEDFSRRLAVAIVLEKNTLFRAAVLLKLEAGVLVRVASKTLMEQTAEARMRVGMLLYRVDELVTEHNFAVSVGKPNQAGNVSIMSDGAAVVVYGTFELPSTSSWGWRIRPPGGVFGAFTQGANDGTINWPKMVFEQVGDTIYVATSNDATTTKPRIRKLVYDPVAQTITDTAVVVTKGYTTGSPAHTVRGLYYDPTNNLIHLHYQIRSAIATNEEVWLEAFDLALTSQYTTLVAAAKFVDTTDFDHYGPLVGSAATFFLMWRNITPSPHTLNVIRVVASASAHALTTETGLPILSVGDQYKNIGAVYDGSNLQIAYVEGSAIVVLQRDSANTYSGPTTVPGTTTPASENPPGGFVFVKRTGTTDLALFSTQVISSKLGTYMTTRRGGTWDASMRLIDAGQMGGNSGTGNGLRQVVGATRSDRFDPHFTTVLYTLNKTNFNENNTGLAINRQPFEVGTIRQYARAAIKMLLEKATLARAASVLVLEPVKFARVAVAVLMEITKVARAAVKILLEAGATPRAASKLVLEAVKTPRAAAILKLEFEKAARTASKILSEKASVARTAVFIFLELIGQVEVRLAVKFSMEKTTTGRAAFKAALEAGATPRAAAKVALEKADLARVAGRMLLEITVTRRLAGKLLSEKVVLRRVPISIRLESARQPGFISDIGDTAGDSLFGKERHRSLSERDENDRFPSTVSENSRGTMTVGDRKKV